MTDEAKIERELRVMLARRDPGAVPPGLEDTVLARMRRGGERRAFRAAWRSLAATIAAVVAVSAIAILLVGRGQTIGPSSVGGPAPAPTAPPGFVAGDGVSEEVRPAIGHVLIAIVVGASLALVAARARRRIVGYAAVVGILGIVWIASMTGTSDALSGEGGAGGVSPFLERPPGYDAGTFVRADGDTEFRILRTVTNTSKLPLDLVGLAPLNPLGTDSIRVARLVGLGYLAPGDCCVPELARPFSRLTLQPGASVDLVILGRAGTCATSDSSAAGATVMESVPLVYDQLTILHVDDVQLPDPVEILGAATCPAPSVAPSGDAPSP